jgi:hypothetical protein
MQLKNREVRAKKRCFREHLNHHLGGTSAAEAAAAFEK